MKRAIAGMTLCLVGSPASRRQSIAPPAASSPATTTPCSSTRWAATTTRPRHLHELQHSRVIDYDVFVNTPKPDFTGVTHIVAVDSVDLRLRKDSKAIDAALVLLNITDGYTGRAPDPGAYEYGAPLPHYGPRDFSTLQGPTSARTTAR
jgi:hypothetical protein